MARIFGRQSVTVAIQDKARYLKAMRDLSLQYPEIQMPITFVQPPRYKDTEEVLAS